MSIYTFDPDLLEPVEDDDPDEPLEGPALATIFRVPTMPKPSGKDPAGELLEVALRVAPRYALYLLEAKKVWNDKLHPRWPQGTPRAGQFMRVGQRFEKGGHTYEIAHIFNNGRMVVHEASGNPAKAKTLTIDPDAKTREVKGITAAKPKVLSGGGTQYGGTATSGGNLPVVDPYVDSSTHDASLKRPAGSKIPDDEWVRFGKVDQEHYLSLMERYGQWNSGKAQGLVNAAYASYDSELKSLIQSSISHQYGSSTGDTLSLSAAFSGSGSVEKQADLYERARELAGELRDIIGWDLYNRAGGPDITAFHNGGTSPSTYYSAYINGDAALMSGYSHAWKYKVGSFGHNTIATPIAIRHIFMATQSAAMSPGAGGMAGENEIAADARLAVDGRSIAFAQQSLTGPEAAWLKKMTSTPTSGSALYDFAAHKAGKGTLKLPPPPAEIQWDHAAGKSWTMPPAHAGAKAHSMGYAGGKKPDQASAADSLGLKPGDFMEGLKGTRYIIVKDPEGAMGLRYLKVNPDGTLNPNRTFPFSDGGTQPFYKLDGHFELPKPKAEAGLPPFDPAAWKGGEKKTLGKMKPGDKFEAEGDWFEVTNVPQSTGHGGMTTPKVAIKSLTTGKTGSANAGHPAQVLGLKAGFSEGVAPEPVADDAPSLDVKPGDWIVRHWPNGTTSLAQAEAVDEDGVTATGFGVGMTVPWDQVEPYEHWAPSSPEKGDVFNFDGKPFKVSSVLKDGTVRAKPPGGPTQKFVPEHAALKRLYRPTAYEHGPKVKAKGLKAGDLVSGSSAKVRPYVVVTAKDGVKLQNLETGEYVTSTPNKGWVTLKPSSAGAPPEMKPPTPVEQKADPELPAKVSKFNGDFDFSAFKSEPAAPVGTLTPGTVFSTSNDTPYQVDKVLPSGAVNAINLLNGKPYKSIKPTKTVTPWTPKGALAVSWEDAKPGDAISPSALPVNAKFKLEGNPGTFQVVVPADYGDPPLIAATSDFDGSLGPPFHLTSAYSDTGTYVGMHTPKATEAPWQEAASLPVADGFKPFKSAWGSGGKFKHDRIKEMGVGEWFVGTDGKPWKVKAAGATSIITDGEKHYAVDGQLRGKHIEHLTKDVFIPPDKSGPLKSDPDQAQAVNAAAVLGETHAGKSLDELDTPAGSHIELDDGSVYKVIGPGKKGIIGPTVQNVETGGTKALPLDTMVSSTSAEVTAATPAPASGFDATRYIEHGPGHQFKGIAKGTVFHAASSVVGPVYAQKTGYSTVTLLHDAGHLKAGDPIEVEALFPTDMMDLYGPNTLIQPLELKEGGGPTFHPEEWEPSGPTAVFNDIPEGGVLSTVIANLGVVYGTKISPNEVEVHAVDTPGAAQSYVGKNVKFGNDEKMATHPVTPLHHAFPDEPPAAPSFEEPFIPEPREPEEEEPSNQDVPMVANLEGTTVGLLKTGEHFKVDGHVWQVLNSDPHWVYAADGYGNASPFLPSYEPEGVENIAPADAPAPPPPTGVTLNLTATESKAFEQAAGNAYWEPGANKPAISAAIDAWTNAHGDAQADTNDVTLDEFTVPPEAATALAAHTTHGPLLDKLIGPVGSSPAAPTVIHSLSVGDKFTAGTEPTEYTITNVYPDGAIDVIWPGHPEPLYQAAGGVKGSLKKGTWHVKPAGTEDDGMGGMAPVSAGSPLSELPVGGTFIDANNQAYEVVSHTGGLGYTVYKPVHGDDSQFSAPSESMVLPATTPGPLPPISLATFGSPGRGPNGKLRNFKAMKVEKLKGVIADLELFGQDTEALHAAHQALAKKTASDAPPPPSAPTASVVKLADSADEFTALSGLQAGQALETSDGYTIAKSTSILFSASKGEWSTPQSYAGIPNVLAAIDAHRELAATPPPFVGQELPAGQVTDVNMNHPDGPKVEIDGGDNWMTLADAQHAWPKLPATDAPTQEPAAIEAVEGTIPSYGSAWGSGGKYKHHHLSELVPGSVFQAKGGGKWKLIQTGDGFVIIRAYSGTEVLKVKDDIRVRKLT